MRKYCPPIFLIAIHKNQGIIFPAKLFFTCIMIGYLLEMNVLCTNMMVCLSTKAMMMTVLSRWWNWRG
ncbi:hypothetical protein [Methylovulum sp.]|uniref:hypothetical protein n=1 Tax=Methylovulum sp. TaxID=1916980 RepID=UPI00343C4074